MAFCLTTSSWPYSETPKCVGNSGYERFLLCGQGSQDELDQLSASLATGMKIQALFCEIPSNPLLHTPDLHRIRELADQYGFCVVCDETLGTYVNVDILPYVDVAITSLTKIFSGGSDVMGGRSVTPGTVNHDVKCISLTAAASLLTHYPATMKPFTPVWRRHTKISSSPGTPSC